MSLETDIAGLVQASDHMTGLVDAKINEFDARITAAQNNVSNYLPQADYRRPYFRLTKNQALEGSGSLPDFWLSGDNVTYTLVQSVISGKAWVDRTQEERELLTAMGRANEVYTYKNFNIWRMDWTAAPHTHTIYQTVNCATPVTVAAYTKLLAGSISEYWASGTANSWKLTGYHHNLFPQRYLNIHPHRQTDTGSMLFALPAAVSGFVPLDDDIWGFIPYIGDTQND